MKTWISTRGGKHFIFQKDSRSKYIMVTIIDDFELTDGLHHPTLEGYFNDKLVFVSDRPLIVEKFKNIEEERKHEL